MMEPISMIVAALAAGALAATQETAGQAVKDAYAGLKALVIKRFGKTADVADAVDRVDARPESAARQEVLKEELAAAGAAGDSEVLAQAETLLELLQGQAGITYTATVSGSGAAAQGEGAAAAGERGIAVGGDLRGGTFNTGTQQTGRYNIVIENAQGLTIGEQQQVTQYFGGGAGEASGTSAGPITARDLRQRQAELQDRYDALTDRIAAVEKDLRRAMDSELKLTLRERRDELVKEREDATKELDEIERRLGS